MTLETFFEKFDLFADAPDAVAKMRELVRHLAVTGKLVAQDPSDEPVKELLSNCLAERRKLKRTAATQLQHSSVDDGLGYDIPESWHWQRLDDLLVFGPSNGFSPNAVDYETPVRSLTLSATTSGRFKGQHSKFITTEVPADSDLWLRDGDILVQRGNTIENVGVAAIYRGEPNCFVYPDLMMKLRVSSALDVGYVHVAMSHGKSRDFLRVRASGTSGSMPKINQATLKSLPLPIPPLAEQKRIVAKVDELMALCDRLEAQQQERETRHAALARASLARFAEAPTPANLPFLFHPSYAIPPADLRKSILTLAVQGKLVPQDPNDEPAEAMLNKIEEEKKRLADRGELKADKKAWVNSSPNPPYDIPGSWCWVRLQDVFEISRGGSPRPAGDPRFFGGPIPWITVGEVTKDTGKYLIQTATGLTEEGSERSRFINPGDLLLTNSGATLGVPKISKIRGCMNDGVAVLRLFHSFDLNDFGYLYLTHQTSAFRNVNQGMGQPNLNTPIIAGWFFPLPPLAEQRRIVAKVEQLMALVDALETQLAASRSTAANLLSALVAELTNQD